MTKTNKTTTDEPNRDITQEMQDRINEDHLDYRAGIGWHDPRGYDPEQDRRMKKALSFTTR